METVEEVLQTVGKTIGVKDLTFGLLLRMAVMFLVGVLVIRVLMKTVDRLLARSQKVEAIRSYIHTAVNIFLWVLLVLMRALWMWTLRPSLPCSAWPDWPYPWPCKIPCPTWPGGWSFW